MHKNEQDKHTKTAESIAENRRVLKRSLKNFSKEKRDRI